MAANRHHKVKPEDKLTPGQEAKKFRKYQESRQDKETRGSASRKKKSNPAMGIPFPS
jgi:hypothetical protein